ncbi:MAG: CoA ester lyase [Rhizobiaceae bacterium]
MPRPNRPRRSVLYVPATSADALAKVGARGADTVIVDLEDSVAPDRKAAAREAVAAFFADTPPKSVEWVIRVNAPSTEWGAEDLALAGRLAPDAILLPKVETPRDLLEVNDVLDEADVPNEVGLWAMIETPRALLNIGAIAELGRDRGARLACLVVGTNDLVKETGVAAERRLLAPWLMQVVLGARASGLTAMDGVYNDFRDVDGFARDCLESAAMGFDGRTLIHPSQVEPANRAYAPSPAALDEARRIVATFALPENAGRGAISLDGRMVERLHLDMAERLIARAGGQSK